MPLISIVIRTKNEERWIGRCLQMIHRQTVKDFETIVVDNCSTDHTLDIARKYPVKILTIENFRPGKAINMGIQASRGKYIAILSAHCIPKDEQWLHHLIRNLESENIAGVYGRQLPFSYSSDLDKRDLLITFGLDHRIQSKDSFFHNANSLIRRSVWEEIPFDEEATNIEDRIWGKAVIDRGYQIAYEPEAAVYHYHGIHQNRDEQRARNVVRILEGLNGEEGQEQTPVGFSPETMNIVALLPVLGPLEKIAGHNLLERCLEQVKSTRYVNQIAVISENPEALETAKRFRAIAIDRPAELSQPHVSVEDVLQYTLQQCEQSNDHFDAVLYVNYLYPFRPEGFFDQLIKKFAKLGVDSLVPTLEDFQPFWREEEGRIIRCDAGLMPRDFKAPVQKGIIGLGSLVSSEFIRKGKVLGDNVALVAFKEPLYSLKAGGMFSKSVISLVIEKGPESFLGHESPSD